MRRIPTLCFITFACLLIGGYVFGQTQSTSGNIQGRVVDPTGSAIPGITITASNPETGFTKVAVSDEDGNFNFVLLPVGRYKIVTAVSNGFARAVSEEIAVSVGGICRITLELKLAALVGSVTIGSGSDNSQASTTSLSSTIDERLIRELPALSRNYIDLVTLSPGIVRDPTRGADLSVDGQKGTLNSIQVDGVSSDNTFFAQPSGRVGIGRAPFQFSIDAVKEFQINQNGYSAEFGRAAGGVINVITRSGTNRLSGSAFWFVKNDIFNANSTSAKAVEAASGLPNERSPVRVNEYGGVLGAPIRKDKIFFFAAYDGQRRITTNVPKLRSLSSAPLAVQALIRPKFHPYALRGPNDSFLWKTDVNVDKNDQFGISFNLQRFVGLNFVNSGLTTPEENNGIQSIKTTTLVANWTRTFSSTWVNEFRVQFARDNQPATAHLTAPQYTVSQASAGEFNDGTISLGGNITLPREITINRQQFIDNLTYVSGNKTIRFGADLLFDHILSLSSDLFRGAYTFANYDNLNNQILDPANQFANQFKQSFAGAGTPGRETHPDSSEYGLYLQNDWRIKPELTLNMGVRYDYQRIAKPQIQNTDPALLSAGYDTAFGPSDTDNIAPRFGFSYVFHSKTIFRGGYGLFFGRTPALLSAAAQSQNGVQIKSISISCLHNPIVACPIFPAVFSAFPVNAAIPIALTIFRHGFQQPFTHQAHVQFQRQLSNQLDLLISYTLVSGRDLTRTVDANLGTPVDTSLPVYEGLVATGESLVFKQYGTRPLNGYTAINVIESSARSLFTGLAIELDRRFAHGLQFNAHYTISNAKDDQPDQVVMSTQNRSDLTDLWARSDVDIKHRFILDWVYEMGRSRIENPALKLILSGYTFSGVFTAQSGAAYSAIVQSDPNNDQIQNNDRVPGTRRNSLSTPARYIVDLRLGRTFVLNERVKMMVFAEGFNVLNRSNVLNLNNIEYTYSLPSSTLPARLTRPSASFGTVKTFLAASQAVNASNSNYNRELQMGIKLEF